jgi:hypothetical protein
MKSVVAPTQARFLLEDVRLHRAKTDVANIHTGIRTVVRQIVEHQQLVA